MGHWNYPSRETRRKPHLWFSARTLVFNICCGQAWLITNSLRNICDRPAALGYFYFIAYTIRLSPNPHLCSVNKCHVHTYFLNHSQDLCKIPNSINVASAVPYRQPTHAYKCYLPVSRQFQSLSWRHPRAGKHSGSSFLIWQHHYKTRWEGGGCRSIFSSCLEGALVL